MPTYEYRCTSCGNQFEIHQRLTDDPLTTCERCGGALRKVFHPAGIVFKGSGFYATDSRKTSKPASEKTASSSDGGSKTSGDKPAEKKSEKPAEKKAAASE